MYARAPKKKTPEKKTTEKKKQKDIHKYEHCRFNNNNNVHLVTNAYANVRRSSHKQRQKEHICMNKHSHIISLLIFACRCIYVVVACFLMYYRYFCFFIVIYSLFDRQIWYNLNIAITHYYVEIVSGFSIKTNTNYNQIYLLISPAFTYLYTKHYSHEHVHYSLALFNTN